MHKLPKKKASRLIPDVEGGKSFPSFATLAFLLTDLNHDSENAVARGGTEANYSLNKKSIDERRIKEELKRGLRIRKPSLQC